MKASDAIAKVLSANNVDFGFELIGGMITHLVDSINKLAKTKLISVHHEQAAAFAAGAIARSTDNQKIGLALATSGPGATNLVTGIADCWLDSIPCLFITGQVNTTELKGNRNLRQQGFQELDIVSIVKSITKYSYQVKTADEIIPCIQKAINISLTGRKGPVLIDIPMNLQREEIDIRMLDYLSELNKKDKNIICNRKPTFSAIDELLQNTKKPLFLIGGGAVNHPEFKFFQKQLSKLNFPHVSSLKGSEKSVSYKTYYGMIGSYGTRTANFAIQNADLIIVLGSRLDIRQTGSLVNDFARNAKIVQIDIDEHQLNNRIKADVNLQIDCGEFFKWFKIQKKYDEHRDWKKQLDDHWKENFVDEYQDLHLSPFLIFSKLNSKFKNEIVHYVSDVGNNQMWASHTIRLTKNQMIHHSGGLGAMGFGIPTGLGIAISRKELVVVITGDGGAQINIQELDIIAREELPILIIVCNNRSLGMVRTFQELYFNGRDESTFWNGYSSSFNNIGYAYNIESKIVNTISQLNEAINHFLQKRKPLLLELLMHDAIECRPRLSFGEPIDKQYPYRED